MQDSALSMLQRNLLKELESETIDNQTSLDNSEGSEHKSNNTQKISKIKNRILNHSS